MVKATLALMALVIAMFSVLTSGVVTTAESRSARVDGSRMANQLDQPAAALAETAAVTALTDANIKAAVNQWVGGLPTSLLL